MNSNKALWVKCDFTRITESMRESREALVTNCKFQEGEASNLHELKDHTFDLVVSSFGAIFAPKPFDVATATRRI